MSKRSGPGRRDFGSKTSFPMRMRPRRTVPTNKSLNRKIKKIQRGQALKFIDNDMNVVISATTGDFFLLNGVTQGPGDHEMIGEDHISTSIQIRGHLAANSTIVNPSVSSRTVRIMVFYDRQSNGAAPVVADLLNNVFAGGQLIYAPYNEDNQERFKFVYDKIKVINPQWGNDAGTAQQNTLVPIKFKRKLGRKVLYKDAPDGTIATINTNALWLFVLSYSATSSPVLQATTRYIFKDQ